MNALQIKIYNLHKKTAQQHLRGAEKEEEGSFYNCMSCIVFCAFMFASYIDHIGMEREPKWQEWDEEKHPSLTDKLKRLSLYKEFTISEKHKISELITIRNLIAHGRTETKKNKKPLNNVKQGLLELQSHLEKECSLKKAKEKLDFFIELIEKINDSAQRQKKRKSELWSLKEGSFQLKSDDQ